MSRTVGISPKFLEKLDDVQKKFILTGVGRAFYDEFLCAHGKHLFIFGTTGSGKTNKGYAFVDWLKHLEKQIWVSSGKIGEILPLLCMGKRVEIIVPAGREISIEERTNEGWQKIPNHPTVIPVSTPREMLMAIGAGSWDRSGHKTRDLITILEIRNAFSRRALAVQWVAEFFEELAIATRDGTISKILPASLHVDESQWTLAGQRVSGDADRAKAGEIIAENAFELRSAGVRLVLYAQDYTNIPPTARENMLFNLLNRGANVKPEENRKLAEWCRHAPQRVPPSPLYFSTEQGRFVFEGNHNGWGDSYPPISPWKFRLYPLRDADREWIRHVRMTGVGKHDIQSEIEEIQFAEPFPELGGLSAVTIPDPEPEFTDCESRYSIPSGMW